MTGGRVIGVMLAVLLGVSGCAGRAGGGDAGAAQAGRAAPLMVEPWQIFNDVPQSP